MVEKIDQVVEFFCSSDGIDTFKSPVIVGFFASVGGGISVFFEWLGSSSQAINGFGVFLQYSVCIAGIVLSIVTIRKRILDTKKKKDSEIS